MEKIISLEAYASTPLFFSLEEAEKFIKDVPAYNYFWESGEGDSYTIYEYRWYPDIEVEWDEDEEKFLYWPVFILEDLHCGKGKGCVWSDPEKTYFNNASEMISHCKEFLRTHPVC